MTSPEVAALRAVLQAQGQEIQAPLEGWRDDVRVAKAGEEDMRDAAQAQVDRLVRRLGMIDQTLAVLDALEADGFPDLPPLEVDAATFAKFEEQVATMTAALARTKPRPAMDAAFVLSAGEEKPTT